MSKRTHFTTVTGLPAGISRETVLDTLHNHIEMIDLNPLVTERHPIKPPPNASPEEFACQWYSISDKVNYLPGGLYTGSVTFNGCFHDLPDGLQTHIYAPMGLNMKGRWTLGGSLPHEPRQPVEIGLGVPKSGLWLREDVDMKCNMVMTGFVKKTTKRAHQTLVDRMIEKSHLKENAIHNDIVTEQISLRNQYPPDYHSSMDSPNPSRSSYADTKGMHSPPMSDAGSLRSSSVRSESHHGGYNQPIGGQQHPHFQQHPPYQDRRLSQNEMQSQGQGSRAQATYPVVEPLFHSRVSAPPPRQFAVEMPAQETRTPVEMDGGQRFY